jgi:pimeloyl-ACP methyl ester carboxylesterase
MVAISVGDARSSQLSTLVRRGRNERASAGCPAQPVAQAGRRAHTALCAETDRVVAGALIDSSPGRETQAVRFHERTVLGRRMLYREAGTRENPTVVLLHGMTSSAWNLSHLIRSLALHFHVVAPDHVGVEVESVPCTGPLDSTPAHLGQHLEVLLEVLDLARVAVFAQDLSITVAAQLVTAEHFPDRVWAVAVEDAHGCGTSPADTEPPGLVATSRTLGSSRSSCRCGAPPGAGWGVDADALVAQGGFPVEQSPFDASLHQLLLHQLLPAVIPSHRVLAASGVPLARYLGQQLPAPPPSHRPPGPVFVTAATSCARDCRGPSVDPHRYLVDDDGRPMSHELCRVGTSLADFFLTHAPSVSR